MDYKTLRKKTKIKLWENYSFTKRIFWLDPRISLFMTAIYKKYPPPKKKLNNNLKKKKPTFSQKGDE